MNTPFIYFDNFKGILQRIKAELQKSVTDKRIVHFIAIPWSYRKYHDLAMKHVTMAKPRDSENPYLYVHPHTNLFKERPDYGEITTGNVVLVLQAMVLYDELYINISVISTITQNHSRCYREEPKAGDLNFDDLYWLLADTELLSCVDKLLIIDEHRLMDIPEGVQ